MTKQFAAPAKTAADADDVSVAEINAPELVAMDKIFEDYSRWVRTRRFYAPPSQPGSILGNLQKRTRPYREPPSAKCSASMAALHLAIKGQPENALDCRVFWLHYGERSANIKAVADMLGISRQHYYRLLRAFCQRVLIAAKQIEDANLLAAGITTAAAQPAAESVTS